MRTRVALEDGQSGDSRLRLGAVRPVGTKNTEAAWLWELSAEAHVATEVAAVSLRQGSSSVGSVPGLRVTQKNRDISRCHCEFEHEALVGDDPFWEKGGKMRTKPDDVAD